MNHKFDEGMMQERDLAFCNKCHCAEATLPTHCPGEVVPIGIRSFIRAGLVDYKDGSWLARRGVEQEWKKVKNPTLLI